jgi:prepilin-type N-terminal cleavage/methylation domain-containing protein
LQHSSPRSWPAGEAGFTLVEVLVVALLLSVVSAALMAPLVVSSRGQSRDMDYAYAQQEARTSVESIVAQVRQARSFNTTLDLQSAPNVDTNTVDMNVNLGGTDLHVVYECDITQPNTSSQYQECVRAQAPLGAPVDMTTGTVVARDLLNGTSTDPVFTLGPSPAAPYYMTATLKIPASGGASAKGGIAGAAYNGLTHPIVFSDGALMRNLNIGN